MLFTNNVVPTVQTRNPKQAYENFEETDNTYDMPKDYMFKEQGKSIRPINTLKEAKRKDVMNYGVPESKIVIGQYGKVELLCMLSCKPLLGFIIHNGKSDFD